MIDRKATTEFLSDILLHTRLMGMGKYYAREVTLDYGAGEGKEKRVDFIQFIPKNQTVSGIEQGHFIFYEIKSCKADYNSGHGLNFEGEKNYIVTTMETYKEIINDIPWDIGVMVACPINRYPTDEFENPTPLHDRTYAWGLKTIKHAHTKDRPRPLAQLLFYMLRSGT